MKKLVIIAVLVGVAIFVYQLRYPKFSWNQKLTLEVETPQGIKTGSAIVGIEVSFGPSGLGDISGTTQSWHGEASVVDLGEGRYLFALLGHPIYMAQNTFAKSVSDDPDYKVLNSKVFYPKMQRIEGPVPVPDHRYFPLLVTFTDINDPASVKKIDPDDLAASFGPGYSLKSITLEITDEPVTKGAVEKVLGWLGKIKGRIKPSNKKYADELTTEEMLYRNDFIKGDK
ncbi:MAG: hypothetical protein GY748_14685 [Planctomycetaceae bacterium]|nr:hypothetical protein [Planctomycetaceae bacterium]